MAAATITALADNYPVEQHPKDVQWKITADFAATGRAIAATESLDNFQIPAGFVYGGSMFYLVTAEGETATLDVGIDGDVDGFLDGGNVNGTAGAQIAKAGTETLAPGYLFKTATNLRWTCPTGANTLNVAKVQMHLWGHMVSLT